MKILTGTRIGRGLSVRSETIDRPGETSPRRAVTPPLRFLGHRRRCVAIMAAHSDPSSIDPENFLNSVPTRFNGVLYRSRLEARWACMFTDLGIYFQHEPDPIRLPSGAVYDPDFFLPNQRVYGEAKGPHNRRLWKPRELHDALLRLDGPGQNLVVILRPAGPTGAACWESTDGREAPFLTLCDACEGWSFTDIDEHNDYFCRRCGASDVLRNAYAPDTLPMPELPRAAA